MEKKDNVLFLTKAKIKKSAEIFTEITDIDLAIVDDKKIRVAATGKCNIDQFLNNNGRVIEKVLLTKKAIEVINPITDSVCKDCVQKKFCKEKWEYCVPILIDNNAIGAISYIVFEDKLKKKILRNKEVFLGMCEKYSRYIENGINLVLSLKSTNKVVRQEGPNKITFNDIIGKSPKFYSMIEKAKLVAPNNASVLIYGETGTGKEMIAKAIHNASSRNNKPFIAVNCGAFPENLIESELFGYVGGAFTGASKNGKVGKFEEANGGTIFLDEITEMPIYLQTRMLRVLQERQIERIGSNTVINLDIRIISATNRSIEDMMAKGLFRQDLYYRLNVIPLRIPPLKDRSDDIVPLMNHFLSKYSDIVRSKEIKNFFLNKKVIEYLKIYSWPGNIRELENVILYLLNMMDIKGEITMKDLPLYLQDQHLREGNSFSSLERLEREAIVDGLEFYGYDTAGKKQTAENLGMGLTTLYRRMKKYNIEDYI